MRIIPGKRCGFTYAEALVVIILTGTLMIPILGTLTTGVNRTESYDHREKLRILARSRLNEEIAAGAFQLSSTSALEMYHHVCYDLQGNLKTVDTPVEASFLDEVATFSSILYSYRISTRLRQQPQIKTDTQQASSTSSLRLLAVRSELLPGARVVATDSYSLMTLVNLPRISEEFIWVSNFRQGIIHAVDPVSRVVVQEFDHPEFDNELFNIAVHPSRRFIAVQTRGIIYALNIDRNCGHYGEIKQILDDSDVPGTFVSGTDPAQGHSHEMGIAFRPDGKYLFSNTRGAPSGLLVVEIEGLDDPDWWDSLGYSNINGVHCPSNEVSDMHIGNDGWVYLSTDDELVRYQMYPSHMPNIASQTIPIEVGVSPKNVVTSRDGKYVYVLQDDGFIKKLNSASANHQHGAVGSFEMPSASNPGHAQAPGQSGNYLRLLLSPCEQYFVVTSNYKHHNDAGITIVRYTDDLFDSGSVQFNRVNHAAQGNVRESAMVLASFDCNNFVVASDFPQNRPPELYIMTYQEAFQGTWEHPTSLEDSFRVLCFSNNDGPFPGMAVRMPEYVVAGTDGSRIEFVDIYAATINRELTIDGLAESSSGLSLSAAGERLIVSFKTNQLKEFDAFNGGYEPDSSHYPCGAVYLATDSYFWAGLANEAWPINGYLASVPTNLFPSDWRFPRNQDFDAQWVPQDLKPLYDGGFMVLLKNADGNAILDWVGPRQWGEDDDIGSYEIFARWTTTADNFPPKHATELAISADEGLLAIMAEIPAQDNKVYLYEFASNNFGHETQLEGFIVDHREEDFPVDPFETEDWNYLSAVKGGLSFKDFSFKDSITSNDDFYNYPANFFRDVVTVRGSAKKRFFGYFNSNADITELALASRYPARMFLNDALTFELMQNDFAHDLDTFASIAGQKIQVDHRTGSDLSDGTAVGLFTGHCGCAAFDETHDSGNYGLDCTSCGSSWNKIRSDQTKPFNFKPTWLTSYPINDSDSASSTLVFCRNVSDPTLFVLTPNSCEISVFRLDQQASKTLRLFGGPNEYLNQMVVSPDGQRLIIAHNTAVETIDISLPVEDSFFDGGEINYDQNWGYGFRKSSVCVGGTVTSLAVRPFNRFSSNVPTATVSVLIDPPVYAQSAAIASGGIYLSGGSWSTSITTSTISLFDPYSQDILSVKNTLLNNNLSHHGSVAYDNRIYTFGGHEDVTDTDTITSWVHSYDPQTNTATSSWETYVTSDVESIRVSHQMNSWASPSPTMISDCGNIYGTQPSWQAYNDNWNPHQGWAINWPPSGHQIYYTGRDYMRFVVNRLFIQNNGSPAANAIEFHGSTDGMDWVELYAGSLDTGTNIDLIIDNSTAYSYYRTTITSGTGDPCGIRNIQFWHDNVRRISPDQHEGGLSSFSSYGDAKAAVEYSCGKIVRWSEDDGGGDEGWRAFFLGSGYDDEDWEIDSDDMGDYNWLHLDLGEAKDIIDIIRIYLQNKNEDLRYFVFQGSNVPVPSDEHDSTHWQTLSIGDSGSDWVETPGDESEEKGFEGLHTFYVENSIAFRHYRILIKDGLNGTWEVNEDLELCYVEFFSTQDPPEPIKKTRLTKLEDDERSEIAVSRSAAVNTPYGIVVAGGRDQSGATDTVSIYWPHAIDEYKSSSGISTLMGYVDSPMDLSLPSFDQVTYPYHSAWIEYDAGTKELSIEVQYFTVAEQGTKHLVIDNVSMPPGGSWAGFTAGTSSTHRQAHHVYHWAVCTTDGPNLNFVDDTDLVLHSSSAGGSTLSLTDNDYNRLGAAWYDSNFLDDDSTSFKTHFHFRLVNDVAGDERGNGMAFVIHGNDTSQVPESGGDGIGYSGISNGIAIVFQARSDSTDRIEVYSLDGIAKKMGISRSLPSLSDPVKDHSLVWHKGKLYRVGGCIALGNALVRNEVFDFETNSWNYTSILSANAGLRRYNIAACSYGDYIYIFGGICDAGNDKHNVLAWNPESDVIFKVPGVILPVDIPRFSSAVRVGSHIYLFGGENTGPDSAPIIRFTPGR